MALPTDINPFVQFAGGATADLGEPIGQSLRFNGLQANVLTRSQVATNLNGNKNFTFSTWFKLGDIEECCIFGCHHSSQENWLLRHVSTGKFDTRHIGNGVINYDTSALFRDSNAWYHLFLTMTGGEMRFWVNNRQTDTVIPSTHQTGLDRPFCIGAETNTGGTPADMYLAETYFIQQVPSGNGPADDGFIRLNEDGIYVPALPTIADYGDNGFHLTYDSTQANGVGHDSSGKGNHFTVTGFNTTAISGTNLENDIDYLDTPTANYALFNNLWDKTEPTPLFAGARNIRTANTIVGQCNFRFPVGTTGKYWVEAGTANSAGSLTAPVIALTSRLDEGAKSDTNWRSTDNYSAIAGYQSEYTNYSTTSYASYTDTGPTVAMGIDFDNQQVLMYNGGTLINTDTTVDFTVELALNVQQPTSSYNTYQPFINTGQQTYQQSPPSADYKNLQVNNFPRATIKNGKKHFDIYTYTSASTAADITFTGWEFQPDFVWFKCTSHGSGHRLYDSVRGVNKGIQSNTTNVEGTDTDAFNSFDSNGFSLGTGNSDINYDSRSFVAWGWKAGGTAVSKTAGTIDSSVSANTTAGFSIVSYTGNGTAGATVEHGLNSAPELIILKDRDTAVNWIVYHKGVDTTNPEQYFLHLNSTAERQDLGDVFNDVAPGSSVFTLGDSTQSNGNTKKYIAYCFHSVEAYCKVGEYIGNGNDNGPFVYTGMRVAFLLVKRAIGGTANWHLVDAERDIHNPTEKWIEPNEAAAEQSGAATQYIDFLSNGFKVRGSGNQTNANTSTYVYIAFAESPFGGENVPPVNAR